MAYYSTVTEGRECPPVCFAATKERIEMDHLVALAFGLSLISAGNAMAGTGAETGTCIIGHRFEPGPIVNGHTRQPTAAEIESRTQQLLAWRQASAGACLAAPNTKEALSSSVSSRS